jgi:hypothetical protein
MSKWKISGRFPDGEFGPYSLIRPPAIRSQNVIVSWNAEDGTDQEKFFKIAEHLYKITDNDLMQPGTVLLEEYDDHDILLHSTSYLQCFPQLIDRRKSD